MRRFVLATALIGSASVAYANGRPPSTSTISFRRGHEQQIVAGMTFGALISTHGGTTGQCTSEDTPQSSGVYAPHYIGTDAGLIFSTSSHGLRVSSDNDCTVGLSAIAMDAPPHSMSLVTMAPN